MKKKIERKEWYQIYKLIDYKKQGGNIKMDFTKATERMLGGQNLHGNISIDISPVIEKLKELKALAARYQTGTPAKVDFSPLIAKLNDAVKIGHDLQVKARNLKV